jgi:tripartite-type tricarboxylate transporter receptor subunit TctC
MYFTGTVGGIPQARAGNLRLLGITHDSRLPGAPEFPTLVEQGLPGVVSYTWYGILAPARTPPAVLDRLAEAIAGAAEEPGFRAQMERDGSVVDATRREAFGRMMADDLAVWSRVIRSMGTQMQR